MDIHASDEVSSEFVRDMISISKKEVDLKVLDPSAHRLNSMTNTTYLMNSCEGKVVARVPGVGTESLIDRSKELVLVRSKIMNSVGPEVLYVDNSGMSVSRYLEDYSILDKPTKELIVLVSKTLSKLHSGSEELIEVDKYLGDKLRISMIKDLIHDYNIDKVQSRYELISKDMMNIITSNIHDIVVKYDRLEDLTYCHRDLMYTNIMTNSTQDNIVLVDWEYGGVMSKYWDIACMICEYEMHFHKTEYELTFDELFSLMQLGYGRELDKTHTIAWCAVVEYIWSIWSLIKYDHGEIEHYEYGYSRMIKCMTYLTSLSMYDSVDYLEEVRYYGER